MAGTAGHRSFGHIRKLPSGKFQASYTGPDVARHLAPVTFTTRSRAEGWLATERGLVERREWTPPKDRAMAQRAEGLTLQEFAEGWLKRRDLKPATRFGYERILAASITESLGDEILRSITPTRVADWYAALNGATPTERAHSYQLLRTLCNAAVREGVITASPCTIRGAGRARRVHQVVPATPAQIAGIVEAITPKYRALVLLGAWCAMRYGELAELRRKDLDLTAGVIRVRRGVAFVGGKAIVGTPKTEAGRRTVTIPPHVLPALRRHLDEFAAPGAEGLIFPAVSGGHVHPTTSNKPFRRACIAAGVPELRFHDLRHSGAVLAAQAGATIADLMARLGHSTPGAAMRYQHTAQGRDAMIAARLSAMIE